MIIYRTTNLINKKIYIGQTNGKRKNYIGSGFKLIKAVEKYGKANFKFEIIVQGNFNQELTNSLERHYINLYNSTDRKTGYNTTKGGNCYHEYTKEQRNKLSLIRKGVKKSEEAKRKMSIAKIGTRQSKETIIKRSKAMMKRVILLNTDSSEDKRFNSIKECATYLNCNPCTISKVLSGKYKTIQGRKIILS